MPLKVLIADDSMTAQNMGKKILTDAGYEVITVSNGAAAVKKIAELRPDVAVLDVFMPGYTGPEVCERMRNVHETAKIPVLLTIGRIEKGAFKQEEANRVKADGVIEKPFEASDLVSWVQKLTAGRAPSFPEPEELPEHEKTIKIDVSEFRDDSYDEWKSTAEEHGGEEHERPSAPPAMSSSAAAAPAFLDEVPADPHGTAVNYMPTVRLDNIKELIQEASEPAYSPTVRLDNVQELIQNAAPPAAVPPPVETPAFGFDMPVPAVEATPLPSITPAPEVPPPSVPDWALPAPGIDAPAAALESIPLEPVAPAITWSEPAEPVPHEEPHALEVEQTSSPAIEVPHALDPHVEFTSAPQAKDVAHEMEAGLESHIHHPSEVHAAGAIGQDPELVTDPHDMMQFTTKFGVEGAEPIVVGLASDLPAALDAHQAEMASVEELPPAEAMTQPEPLPDAVPEMAAFEPAVAEMPMAAPAMEEAIAPALEPVTPVEMPEPAMEMAAPVEASMPEVPVRETVAIEPQIAMAAPVRETVSIEPPVAMETPMVEAPAQEPPPPVTPAADEFEARVNAAMQSGWVAEEHHLNTGEHNLNLELEMARHYQEQAAAAPAEPVAPAVEAMPAAPEPPATAPQHDMELAAAMAAAVGAEVTHSVAPAVAEAATGTIGMDPELIARIVNRVTERMKPDLIAEITRELMAEAKKRS